VIIQIFNGSEKGVRCDPKVILFDFEIVRYDVDIVHYDPENTVINHGLLIGSNSNNRLTNIMCELHYPQRPPQADGDSLQQEMRALQTFLQKLHELHPVIPDPVINNMIAQVGFGTSDQRVARIFNVATQKFIVDVLSELQPGTTNVLLDMIKQVLALCGIVSHRPEVVLSPEGDDDRAPSATIRSPTR
jgi:hypothetical protein